MEEVNLSQLVVENTTRIQENSVSQGFDWLPPTVLFSVVVFLALVVVDFHVEEWTESRAVRVLVHASVLIQVAVLGILLLQGGGFL